MNTVHFLSKKQLKSSKSYRLVIILEYNLSELNKDICDVLIVLINVNNNYTKKTNYVF